MPHGSPRPTTKTDVKRLIVRLLEEETGDDYTDLARRIDFDLSCDANVDSLSMVNIVLDLEEALGIKVEDGDITPERVRSVDAFADFLISKIAAAEVPRAAAG